MNKDTVVGILGAVILVAAMVGIFYYEGTQAPGGSAAAGGSGPFAVTWKSDMTSLAAVSGQSQLGQSASQTVNVTAANVTKAEFALTWTNDQAPIGPEKLTLTVKAPDGKTYTASGDTGTVTVLVSPVNAEPAVNHTGGASEADAQSALAGAYTTTNGTGAWTVTVNYDAVEGQAGAVPNPGLPVPVGATNPMPWSVTPKLTTYSSQVQRA